MSPSPDLERRRKLTLVYWWLLETLPELWYAAPFDDVIDLAEALVTLRSGVDAGRWAVEVVV